MSKNTQVPADAQLIGKLIIDQSPYGTPETIGGDPESKEYDRKDHIDKPTQEAIEASPVEGIELDGPGRYHFNHAGKLLTDSDINKIREAPQDGVWWYFHGRPRFVTKAIRVAYTYTAPGADKPRTDHFLIGYEGAGWA